MPHENVLCSWSLTGASREPRKPAPPGFLQRGVFVFRAKRRSRHSFRIQSRAAHLKTVPLLPIGLPSTGISFIRHLNYSFPFFSILSPFQFMEFRRAILLLMLPGRAVDAAGAVGGRTAPDALVRPGTVTVFARRGMDAARAIGRGTAPFAMPLVVTVLVLARRAVNAARTIAR